MPKLIYNPITAFLKDYITSILLEIRHRHLKLKIGHYCKIKDTTFAQHNTIYNGVTIRHSSLGRYTYISNKTSINKTSIGSFCSIGPDCKIGLGKHPASDLVSTHPAFYSNQKQCGDTFTQKNYFEEHESIVIGHDIWIGANVVIADGVHIGNGAIVSAGAVVVSNVPPYAVVGGVPAKVIKFRFQPDEVDFLIQHPWWEKDEQWLRENFLTMHDIKQYVSNEKNV